MLNKLLKLSAALLLLLIISASSVMASGKMEVKLGDSVSLQSQETSGGTHKWVVRKGREILSTQGTSLFSYTFNQQGEYEVVLTITDTSGATRSTTVFVLVGERYSAPVATGTTVEGGVLDVPLSVGYGTLPLETSQRSVHILGDEGRVVFDIGTRDDILEYRVDRNIFVDSDGNGIANDDIDNADHSSYLLGGIYQTKYLASESNKIAAEITIVNKAGQKAKTQVEIFFDSLPGKDGNVVAVLDTLPLLNSEDKKVYVWDAIHTVGFYSRRSQGDIIEYRIDKNIFVDSDGDGNPANDIDNKNDTSFKTGDVWTTGYNKTDDQIIAQLIVVGRGGSGSRIQREIKFTDKPLIEVPEVTPGDSAIQLRADKDFVQKGDPINFEVSGLSQSFDNYIFDWDFDGDGEVDQSVEGINIVSYIYDEPGIQQAKVNVHDSDGNEASFSMDVLVKDIAVTTADFEYTVDGDTVTFTDLSIVSSNLTNKNLSYTWNFGDTDPVSYEAQRDKIGLQNPTYTYTGSGTYIVTLQVVDSDQVTSTKSAEVMFEGVAAEEVTPEDTPGETSDGGGSLIGTIFKGILYVILVILLLVILIIMGLLVFLKIQHPDLVFEELIDELKIKLLGMMGVHEPLQADAKVGPVSAESSVRDSAMKDAATGEEKKGEPEKPEETSESGEEPDEAEEAQSGQPELAKQDAPVPDWLKATKPAKVPTRESDVIEGEVEEESAGESNVVMTEEVTIDEPIQEAPDVQPESPQSSAEETPVSETGSEPDQSADEGQAESGDLKKSDGPVPDWLKND